MKESYFQYHLFFCTNRRDDGMPCCGDHSAREFRDRAKQRVKELGSAITGNVRVNVAGCLNRCGEGPVLVVYPQGVWYRYETWEDLEEIISEHLCKGRAVARLKI